MRGIFVGSLVLMSVCLMGTAGTPAAPINGAALATAAAGLSQVEPVRVARGGGAVRGGGAARGGGVAVRGGGVAVRGGGVAVRGGGVAVRGGGVAVRRGGVAVRGGRVYGGRVWRGGRWIYTGGCTYDLYVQGLCG
jgi:hypothetical protein